MMWQRADFTTGRESVQRMSNYRSPRGCAKELRALIIYFISDVLRR